MNTQNNSLPSLKVPLEVLSDRDDLGIWLNSNGFFGIGAEIGVAQAENAEQILTKWQGSGMFLVDPWCLDKCGEYIDGSAKIDFDEAHGQAISRMSKFPGRSIILRMTSNEALNVVPDRFLDFVYIDGNHHNPQFNNDLVNWIYKVKIGGLVGGHDYYDLDESYYKCEVKSTVDSFVEKHGLDLHTTQLRDLDKSWWFINKELK